MGAARRVDDRRGVGGRPTAAGVGDWVDGYRLDALVGAGGGGTVYRATDPATGARVAIKHLAAGADRRELAALGRLDHPAVVRSRKQVRDLRGEFLVTDWLDGATLAAAIGRGPMATADLIALAHRLGDGLAAIHAAGVVHRDLKPGNVILVDGAAARATIIDFGIAASTGVAPPAVGGTPAYMAPEQARGAQPDGRADVFALGLILHEAATGRPVHAAAHAIATIARLLLDPPPPVERDRPDLPAGLVALIAAMLAADPALRPGAAEVAARARTIALTDAPPPPRAIGGDERRTASVVVAHLTAPADLPRLRAELAPLGARVERIGDASLAIALDAGDVAIDRAVAAARAARAVNRVVGGTAAVATGKDAFDAACALLAAAPEAGTLVDDATAALLETRFALTALGAGRWRLDGEHRDRDRRVLGVVTPLVGRDRELRLFATLADEVRTSGAAQAVRVVAPAGAGKSRLFRELAAQLGAGFTVCVGRGDPMRASSPFAVIAELVRAGLGLGERADRAALRARLAGAPHADRIGAFLGELLGLPGDDGHVQLRAARQDPILMHDQLRRAFIDCLRHAAAAGPVALCLDDAQWIDPPSRRFLDEAVRQVGDAPVLFAAFARPLDGDDRAPIFDGLGATELRLGPLSARAATALVHAVLGDRDPAACARIVERAAGNALVLEELIRAVGAPTGVPAALPTTVVAMVHGRLAGLAPVARRALRVASIAGRTAARGLVAALTASTDEAIAATLTELVDREILVRAVPSADPELDVYGFRHDLVREACYDMLTDDDRRAGHRAVGAWLAARDLAEPIVLAHHYELGDAPAEAAHHWHQAARRALAANDFGGVVGAAQRALALGADDAGALELLLAEAHTWRGELALAAHAAERAAARLAPGEARWFRAISAIATVRGRFGDYPGIAAHSAHALAAHAADDAATAQLACLCALSRQHFHGGRYAEAGALLRRIDELAPAADALEPTLAAQIHGVRAAAARHAGDLAGDLDGYQAVMRAFLAAGDVRNACNARVSVGFALIELGAWAEAEAALTTALAEASAMGLATVATRARQNLCLVLAERGAFAPARALVVQTIRESRAHGNARFEGWTAIYRAQIELAAGAVDDAAAIAHAAAAHLTISPPARAGALAVVARAELARGQVAVAHAAAAEAEAILAPLGSIEEFEAPVRLAWALALDAAGDHATRDRAIATARDRLRARAAAITDPERRRSFLDDVRDNQATLACAAAWLAT
jgi:hypothetical protein